MPCGIVAHELAGKEKMHLAGVDDVNRRKQMADLDGRAGFLERLAGRAAGKRLAYTTGVGLFLLIGIFLR